MKKILGITILFLTYINISLANTSLPKCIGTNDTKFRNCYGEYLKKEIFKDESGQIWTRTFKGEFGNTSGVRDGYGSSITYLNDNFQFRFDGEFKNDRVTYGIEEWHNKFKFEGEFKDGERFFGKAGYPNETTYFGELINGLPNGFAKLTDKNGNLFYLGNTINSQAHGLGFAFFRDDLPAAVYVDLSKNDKETFKVINSDQLKKLQEQEKRFLKKELNYLVNFKVKSECDGLGFIRRSDDYLNCILKLTALYKEQAIEEQKIKIAEQQAKLAQRQLKAAEAQAKSAKSLARDSSSAANDAMIKRGLGLMNGTCDFATLYKC
jgi:hypothetical protein